MQERIWFKIGEAAQRAGVSPKELRYWEKMIPELRPKRSIGNQRHYHRDDLPKLSLIAFWVKSGLPVADCRELVATSGPAIELGAAGAETAATAEIADGAENKVPALQRLDTAHIQNHPNGTQDPSAVPLFDFPEIYGEGTKAQLQSIADSLKALLARLQKPIY
ncbi:MAG: MerR family transcriptional regulator [Holophagales bacterium]|jgi:DNA-binding transcriptional MerR regulator|nr:MerR family transcriptional regulator [Holophagales bacterium]